MRWGIGSSHYQEVVQESAFAIPTGRCIVISFWLPHFIRASNLSNRRCQAASSFGKGTAGDLPQVIGFRLDCYFNWLSAAFHDDRTRGAVGLLSWYLFSTLGRVEARDCGILHYWTSFGPVPQWVFAPVSPKDGSGGVPSLSLLTGCHQFRSSHTVWPAEVDTRIATKQSLRLVILTIPRRREYAS